MTALLLKVLVASCRVIPHQGADTGDLKSISVTMDDKGAYTMEIGYYGGYEYPHAFGVAQYFDDVDMLGYFSEELNISLEIEAVDQTKAIAREGTFGQFVTEMVCD
jgi:hypothetical protein